jgi:hypothetical protein
VLVGREESVSEHKYDVADVHTYMDAVRALPENAQVYLWFTLYFERPVLSTGAMYEHFCNLSAWAKANVMFSFIPLVEAAAVGAGKVYAMRARAEEE